jgi:hypothetical protein
MRKSKHGGLASARNHGTAASGTRTTFWGGGKSSGPVTNLAENARRPGLEPLRSNGGGGRSRIGRESRSGAGRRREEEARTRTQFCVCASRLARLQPRIYFVYFLTFCFWMLCGKALVGYLFRDELPAHHSGFSISKHL